MPAYSTSGLFSPPETLVRLMIVHLTFSPPGTAAYLVFFSSTIMNNDGFNVFYLTFSLFSPNVIKVRLMLQAYFHLSHKREINAAFGFILL